MAGVGGRRGFGVGIAESCGHQGTEVGKGWGGIQVFQKLVAAIIMLSHWLMYKVCRVY